MQDWAFDGVGNLPSPKLRQAGWASTTVNGTQQDREHDAANQITHLDGEEYDIDHDKAGNMILVPKIPLPGFAPGRFVCKYDAWNRLTAVYEDDGTTPGHWDETDTKVAEYRYDGLNRRITKLVPNAQSPDNWDRTDYYYNEGWQVLEERTVSNLTDPETVAEDPHVQYVWDVRYIDAPICRFRDADGSSGNGLEETLYYTTDANFNVTALIDPADGGVVERYLYDGYGRVTVLNGAEDGDETGMDEWTIDADNVSDWDNEILYAGYRLDGETNLYHVRNRYHHPTLGRFISRDPEGYVDGMSFYEYVGSQPITFLDPNGQDRLEAKVKLDENTGKVSVDIYYVDEPSWEGGIFTLGINYLVGDGEPVYVGTLDNDNPSHIRLKNGRYSTMTAVRKHCDAGGTDWEEFGKGDYTFSKKPEDNLPTRGTPSLRQAHVYKRLAVSERLKDIKQYGGKGWAPLTADVLAADIDEVFEATDLAAEWVKDLMWFYATVPVELAASVRKVGDVTRLTSSLRQCKKVTGSRRFTFGGVSAAATRAYPGLAGKFHRHHVVPTYVAKHLGIRNALTFRLPAAYHQVLHNHIRWTLGWGKNAPWRRWPKARVFAELRKVYERFPLPKGFEDAMKVAGL